MKIVIIGDGGFIGSNLAEHFGQERQDEIVGISRKVANAADPKRDYKRHEADINDTSNLYDILYSEKPEWIVNLASDTEMGRSFEHPYNFMSVNFIGTFNLLEWLRHNKQVKMLHFSTDQVITGQIQPAYEDSRLTPWNPYGASKAAADIYVEAYNRCYGLDVRILRPFNVFGKYQRGVKLFSKIAVNALKNKPFNLYADPSNHKKGWVYAGNLYYAAMAVMQKGNPGESYNMQADTILSVDELKDIILNKLGKKELFKGYINPQNQQDEPFSDLDSGKIKKIYKPEYTFDTGLEKTIEWFNKTI